MERIHMKAVEKFDPFYFPIAVYRGVPSKLINKLREIALLEEQKNPDITEKWAEKEALSLPYPEMTVLKSIFEETARDYLEAEGFTPKAMNMYSWLNVRRGRSRHIKHSHPVVDLILNLYISTPETSSIVYLNTNPAPSFLQWSHARGNEFILPVEEGMLVVTPPWVIHEVPETNSDLPRISISCNFYGVV